MHEVETKQKVAQEYVDYVDGVISADSSFYGDDEHKIQLEDLSGAFDEFGAWKERHDTLADKALANLAKEKVRENAKLYNPYQGAICGRQLEESLDEFLKRLPPSTSAISRALPWIFCANPYFPSRGHEGYEDGTEPGLQRFKEGGKALLDDLLEYKTRKATEVVGKPPEMLTKFINKKRSETVDKIQRLAIETEVTSGKWMLFIPPVNIDDIWKSIADATISGDLGTAAKVAPYDKEEDPLCRRHRLICVYTKDFSDIKDVVRVLEELKRLGMVDTRGKFISYKPDAYTYLQINANNPYDIKPTIYNSSNAFILAKESVEGRRGQSMK